MEACRCLHMHTCHQLSHSPRLPLIAGRPPFIPSLPSPGLSTDPQPAPNPRYLGFIGTLSQPNSHHTTSGSHIVQRLGIQFPFLLLLRELVGLIPGRLPMSCQTHRFFIEDQAQTRHHRKRHTGNLCGNELLLTFSWFKEILIHSP